jgi:hypothetical protein
MIRRAFLNEAQTVSCLVSDLEDLVFLHCETPQPNSKDRCLRCSYRMTDIIPKSRLSEESHMIAFTSEWPRYLSKILSGYCSYLEFPSSREAVKSRNDIKK